MYRRPQDIKNKITNPTPTNKRPPLNKTYSYSEATSSVIVPKLTLNDNDKKEARKSGITTPLTFSTRCNSKQRLGYFGEPELNNKNGFLKKPASLYEPPHQCQKLKQSRKQNQTLKKQIQKLKSDHKLILGHLNESKRSFMNLNIAYETKCEQAETLKSIVSSIKDYVFRQDRTQPTPLTQRTNTEQKTLLDIPHKRRVSIRDMSVTIKTTEDQLSKRVLMKLEQYAHMKLSQSIKGSIYDLYSQKQL